MAADELHDKLMSSLYPDEDDETSHGTPSASSPVSVDDRGVPLDVIAPDVREQVIDEMKLGDCLDFMASISRMVDYAIFNAMHGYERAPVS